MRVITSMSKSGYKEYGETCLKSMVEHLPCPITVYHENEKFDFEHEKIEYRNLYEVEGCENLLTILSTLPVFSGEIQKGKRDYRWNAFKFIRKCFAQIDAACQEDDCLFWIDADTVWDKNISEEVLRDMTDDTFMAYMGRDDFHSCASFVGWNLRHKNGDRFWQEYYDFLMSGRFLLMQEWHDSYLLDRLREGLHVDSKNLAEGLKAGRGPINIFNKVFKGTARHMKGNLKHGPQRYEQLIDLVIERQPQSIMEIGTWNGHRAIEMIYQVPDAQYFGFDLFETATHETDEEEKNVKPHHSADDVAQLLQINKIKAELYKGDTKDTLPVYLDKHGESSIDFIFIDGGHSVETIRSDWEHAKKAIKKGGIVVFDDYYNGMPDLDKYGANEVLKDLDFELLPIADPVKGGGTTQMAVVRC